MERRFGKICIRESSDSDSNSDSESTSSGGSDSSEEEINNYAQGKIYQLTSKMTDKVYIGSTYLDLKKRLRKHIDAFLGYKRGTYHYVSSFELIKHDDCEIELIANYPCSSKTELEREEGKYIQQLDCVNHRIAGRTSKEYVAANSAKKAQYDKKRRAALGEKLKNQKKEAYKKANAVPFACECGSTINKTSLRQHLKSLKHQNFMNQKK